MITISFRQKRLPCRPVSDCSGLLNFLHRKQSEKYSAKWDRGFSLLIMIYDSYERFLVTGLREKDLLRIGQKLHKIIILPSKSRGSIPILTNLVGLQPKNIHTKFDANLCGGLREVETVLDCYNNNNNDKHRVIATHTHPLSVKTSDER